MRNAGNLIPHAQHFQDEYFSCEPAALELGCVVNDIRHIIVCGHSDCKAMNLLYQLRDPDFASKVSASNLPLYSLFKSNFSLSLTVESSPVAAALLAVHTCQHQPGQVSGMARCRHDGAPDLLLRDTSTSLRGLH